MTNYIERYWRDATPQDAIKEPPMVARFRDDPSDDWIMDLLCGHDTRRGYWFSSSNDISETLWWHCQVYDAPDPGEGWRLIDTEKEQPQKGDEWLYDNGVWKERVCGGVSGFSRFDTYRRRIEPPKPKYVPFTWEDREQLRGRWICLGTSEVQIQGLTNHDKFYINGICPEVLVRYWVFLDTGEPVGRKVME